MAHGRASLLPTSTFWRPQFSSLHGDLIQFAMADGSVRQLTNIAQFNGAGFPLLLALGGIADGRWWKWRLPPTAPPVVNRVNRPDSRGSARGRGEGRL